MPSVNKSTTSKSAKKSVRKKVTEPKLSRQRRPDDMSVAEWQLRLRRQFGREQSFKLENLGHESIFSEFAVSNPESGTRYRVAIRSKQIGENFCSCPDFSTNDLGTCKHIEFVLAKLEAKRGGKAALRTDFRPPYSEIYLRYVGARGLHFRAGLDCPPKLAAQAAKLFGESLNAESLPDHISELDLLLVAAQKSGHEIRCYDDAQAFIAEIRDAETRRHILDKAYPEGARSAALSGLLKTQLYPYQAEGVLVCRASRAGFDRR